MKSFCILFLGCLTTVFAKNIVPEFTGSSGGLGVGESGGTAEASDPNGNASVSISSGVSSGGSGSINSWQTTDGGTGVVSQGSGSNGSGYGNAYGTAQASGAEASGTVENVGYGVGSGQEVPEVHHPAAPAGQRQGRWFYPYGSYGGGYYNPYYYYGKK